MQTPTTAEARTPMVTSSKYLDRAEQIAEELKAAGLTATVVPVYQVCVVSGEYFQAMKLVRQRKGRV